MSNDIFDDIFRDIDRTIGNFDYKKGQRIKVEKINVFHRDHVIESWGSKIGGELLKIDYYIAKKEDGTVEIIKAPPNLQREIQIVHDDNDIVRWKVLGLEGDSYTNKKSPVEESNIVFFIPELDLASKSIYQFVFGSFLRSNFSLYNVSDYDSNYHNKNNLRKKHFQTTQYFSKSFEDFIKKLNQLINSNRKYYVVSTINYKTLIDMFIDKKCIHRKDHFVKTKMLEFVEKAENWVSILGLFAGWYYKAKNPIQFSESHYESPVSYLNYLALRSSLMKYKKTKNVNLRYIKNIMKKYYFTKETDNKPEENKQFDLFEKLSIMYNVFQILLYRKGGFAE